MTALAHPLGVATLGPTTGRRTPADRLIASRVRVLTEIAERFSELVDPLNGPSGFHGDGESVGLMPHDRRCLIRASSPPRCTCAYRSVAEFGRLTVRLREEQRPLWWHLDGWWLSAVSRTVYHCPRCGVTHKPSHVHPSRRNSGKPVDVRCKRVVVWTRRPGARESFAKEAVETMAGWWMLGSEPMLPDEIRVAA